MRAKKITERVPLASCGMDKTAQLHVYGFAKMDDSAVKEVCAWLRQQADYLETRDRNKYSRKAFTCTLYLRGDRG